MTITFRFKDWRDTRLKSASTPPGPAQTPIFHCLETWTCACGWNLKMISGRKPKAKLAVLYYPETAGGAVEGMPQERLKIGFALGPCETTIF